MKAASRFLLIFGTVAAIAGWSKWHAARHGYDFTASPRLAWACAFVAVVFVCGYAIGLPGRVGRGWRAARAATGVVGLAVMFISLVQLFAGDALLPRLVLALSAATLVPLYVVAAEMAHAGRARRERRDAVLLLGTESEARALAEDIASDAEVPASFAGFITCDEVRAAPSDSLLKKARQHAASVLVLNRFAQTDDRIVHQAAVAHEAGIRVRTLSLFYEEWLAMIPAAELERVSLFTDIGEVHRSRYGRASRLFDLAVALLALPALAAVVPAVLVGNLVGNRGPLLYTQPRVGKNGHEFRIWKFRTMRPDLAGAALRTEWTSENDPRITSFGRVLRRTHIDELPQLANILRGDLSIVGPRPEQPHYVRELESKIPFYGLRHLVTPGLTGWAQVKYGYAGSEADAVQKLQYEFYYLKRQSLALDLKIVVRTIRQVVGAGGR